MLSGISVVSSEACGLNQWFKTRIGMSIVECFIMEIIMDIYGERMVLISL